MRIWLKHSAVAFGLAIALSSCGSETESASGSDDRSGDPLAEVIADDDTLSMATSAFGQTGLVGVLEGEASYTVFAPSDAAFEALGVDAAALIADNERGAVVAAILRDHMVPGSLTPEAIREAIEGNGGTVSMASFGTGTLTFALDGENVVVSNESGQRANLLSDGVIAQNGIVVPIDQVLVDPAAIPGAAEESGGDQ